MRIKQTNRPSDADDAVNVIIQSSQFPDQVRRDLLDSLRTKSVNHKFHYDSIKQAEKWFAVHRAYSPAQIDIEGIAIYDRSVQAVADAVRGTTKLNVIGLGCGGGQKDVRLLEALERPRRVVRYFPCDVSTAMVLTAHERAAPVIGRKHCQPFIFDLASVRDLSSVLNSVVPRTERRVVTFFGMLPNFEPNAVLGQLERATRPNDLLLLSANLAPGPNYLRGIQQVFPQYDNRLTRDWLLTFLLDLGVARDDGEIRFAIENCPAVKGIKRIAAYFIFRRRRQIGIGREKFQFKAGSKLRLFFSYRYTLNQLQRLLTERHLAVRDQWVTGSGEEGVFYCRRNQDQ